jgi:hypothetical protein
VEEGHSEPRRRRGIGAAETAPPPRFLALFGARNDIVGFRHRRDRSGVRAGQSACDLRGTLADAPHAVERLSAVERSGQRVVQVDGWRRHVDGTEGHRQTGADRNRRRAVNAEPRLRDRRRRSGRDVSLRRPGRDVDANVVEIRDAHLVARLVLRRDHRRAEECRHRVLVQRQPLSIDRRRCDVGSRQRCAGRRRLPRALDRS